MCQADPSQKHMVQVSRHPQPNQGALLEDDEQHGREREAGTSGLRVDTLGQLEGVSLIGEVEAGLLLTSCMWHLPTNLHTAFWPALCTAHQRARFQAQLQLRQLVPRLGSRA